MSSELGTQLADKRDALVQLLRSCGRVAVAYSGGVDSSVVAKGAAMGCGDRAVAVIAVSPSLASGELEAAESLAQQIGIRFRRLSTNEIASPGYVQNAGNRCYFCKTELYTQLHMCAEELQVDVICNGANVDDLGDHRPGMQAAEEHRVRSPLIEVGLTKAEVRELARHWNLPVWDKPASPCLSSRLAYGVEVTAQRLLRVDAAERFLREQFGIRELRVRVEANDLARIEVPVAVLGELAQPERRTQIAEHFRQLGFRYITLDLEGFRTGSLNTALPMVDLQQSVVEGQ
ncbi:MAG: ATP-dependent sacrificial sulfur transferase LarE [Planctomycetaceae bacterium]|nr:ATP-dependent sacrificial sulfur transferase LarE [Planctomycetaceae bacterium]